MDAGKLLAFDVVRGRIVKTIAARGVHGDITVPELGRVYASAANAHEVLTLNARTGAILARAPAGQYPDGLVYDPVERRIFVSDESGGVETVLTTAGHRIATISLGGEAGNVQYDSSSRRVLADVQTLNEVAVIEPRTNRIVRRVHLANCVNDHSLLVDSPHRLAFIACDGNARLLTLNLTTWQVTSTSQVGDQPDVLAYDPAAGRLYVAAESGDLTILDNHRGHLTVTGRAHLADGSHVVAVDPATHDSYYPIPDGPDGRPVLLIYQPVPESPSAAYRPGRQDRAELSGRSAARIPRRSAEGVR
jgi:DNA-binding beta-propeller fold protein YncE